ncbi:hypothetical protein AVEN_177222-1 [Araneus ventricosus]|uniref:Uncharacterized protein n=1 Tax=Araneus ventricosus TaxID=182803 RepID=A0A4Y2KVH4_ARAVE|nr:hypothetical protein AVEN_177222-1 [Araneus ventricosus]
MFYSIYDKRPANIVSSDKTYQNKKKSSLRINFPAFPRFEGILRSTGHPGFVTRAQSSFVTPGHNEILPFLPAPPSLQTTQRGKIGD